MSRVTNNTVSDQEIQAVHTQAQDLLQALQDIQFVMTDTEQRGLYSLIRNLEFETWDRDTAPTTPQASIRSKKLHDLLDQLKADIKIN